MLNQVLLEVCPAHVLNEAGKHDSNVLQRCPGCKCSANSGILHLNFSSMPNQNKPPSQLEVGQQSPSDVKKRT